LTATVRRLLALDDYLAPILVGQSPGATLAYAIAAQAPKGTFAKRPSRTSCSPRRGAVQRLDRLPG
jgi:type IV secretory pathway VirJ component